MKVAPNLYQIMEPINKAIYDILDYYTCPPECHAYCCKLSTIEMTPRERKILRKRSKEKTDNLKSVKRGEHKFYELPVPCPFLGDDDKCTVYAIKPTRCNTFPFNLNGSTLRMVIYPCKMGLEICADYFEYKIFEMKTKNNKDLIEQKSKLFECLEQQKEISKKYYSGCDEDIQMVSLSFGEIIEFQKYLYTVKNRF